MIMDHFILQTKHSLNDYLVALQSTSIYMVWKELELKNYQANID
jgi:hypothetical protein